MLRFELRNIESYKLLTRIEIMVSIRNAGCKLPHFILRSLGVVHIDPLPLLRFYYISQTPVHL